MTPLRTLSIVTDPGGRRFYVCEVGSTSVVEIRREHVALRRVVAALVGVDPGSLTLDQVLALTDAQLAQAHAATCSVVDASQDEDGA